AYPALAQSLFQTGQAEEAIALLESAALVDSPASGDIRHTLVSMLSQCGETGKLAQLCLRFSTGIQDDLLAARGFAWTDPTGEWLVAALEQIQDRLAALPPHCEAQRDAAIHAAVQPPATPEQSAPIHIAFLLGDVVREARLDRLDALLAHLPAQDFILTLFCSDKRLEAPLSALEGVSLNFLLFDAILIIDRDADKLATFQYLPEAAPEVLIDLEAYGPEDSPMLLARAPIPHKLLWGETPLPPLLPTCQTLAGARLGIEEQFPCASLPGLGEVYDFPEIPFESPDESAVGPAFACLDAANRIGDDGWRLFAEALGAHPKATLLLNLGALKHEAKDFIRARFARFGIAPERLRFVRAGNSEELCRLWQSVDFGLCPPIDGGGPALPAALWMGKPCLALDSPLPWSRRAAVLLEAAGAARWIARDAAEYVALARHLAHEAPRAPDPALRAQIKQLGLNDPASFARGFAEALRALARGAQTASPETRP
ncbi:MAG: hypothetical protein LBR95_03095, partial [Azoarcus sp.]|nr:hypothetical protein [Azoarcus sp.]